MTVGHQPEPDVVSPVPSRLAPYRSLVSDLYSRSAAAEYSISLSDFTQILEDITLTQLVAEDGESVPDFLARLRMEELVLARACAAGSERAWDVFLTRHREGLYTAALSIARNDGLARELADSLYADLFGTETAQGARVSKLRSYMGIGSLQGWLRTILAHTYIDRHRSERPMVSLTPTEDEEEFDVPAPPAAEFQPVDGRLESATTEALEELKAEDRYLLASYFLHGRTLAEIGRILGLHESTVKRRIDKLTGRIRKKITAGLTKRGMTRAQAEEAIEVDVRDLQLNIRSSLEENVQDQAPGPSLKQEQSETDAPPSPRDRREIE